VKPREDALVRAIELTKRDGSLSAFRQPLEDLLFVEMESMPHGYRAALMLTIIRMNPPKALWDALRA
jgi:hypothetical protein